MQPTYLKPDRLLGRHCLWPRLCTARPRLREVRSELRAVIAGNRRSLYLLGLLLAVFYFIPLVNLLASALSGLAFAHFQLGALAKLRVGHVTKGELRLPSP